jgi:hypothetical protein
VVLELVPDELELCGRALVGEALLANGSKPKKDHFLVVLVGLAFTGEEIPGLEMPAREEMELRLRGEDVSPFSTCKLGVRSRTAPAVLGLEPLRLDTGEPMRFGVSRSGAIEFEIEMIEDMLPDDE